MYNPAIQKQKTLESFDSYTVDNTILESDLLLATEMELGPLVLSCSSAGKGGVGSSITIFFVGRMARFADNRRIRISFAARSPACTAPLKKPLQAVAVSVPVGVQSAIDINSLISQMRTSPVDPSARCPHVSATNTEHTSRIMWNRAPTIVRLRSPVMLHISHRIKRFWTKEVTQCLQHSRLSLCKSFSSSLKYVS